MHQKQRLICAISSGILLSLPWLEIVSGLILLIAFVPLLFFESIEASSYKRERKTSFFLYVSLSFFIWNTASTWWIGNASVAGAATAILLNTFLFSSVFWLFHITKRIAGDVIGSLSLIAYWTAFEYGYLNAEISWPWLNLGNGLAHDIHLIQWYEYTGTLGGTVWILTVNIFLCNLIKQFLTPVTNTKITLAISITSLLIIIPIVISLIRFHSYQEKKSPCIITVIQPNINPYQAVDINARYRILANLIDSSANQNSNYFVAPEAILDDFILENSLKTNKRLNQLRKKFSRFHLVQLVTGATTFKRYPPGEKAPASAHHLDQSNWLYTSFNTAIQIDSGRETRIYHKSKLVTGVEKMPYSETLKFMKPLVEKLGGSFASHETQNFRGVFSVTGSNIRTAPLICYESIYGEFVTGYILNGANLLLILTNDGWWGNTPGYRQHLSYASLRAIETRRSIARSANTGISSFINQRGEQTKTLGWNIRGCITETLNSNNDLTFYVRNGDYIGKIAAWLAGGILLMMAGLFIIKKRTKILDHPKNTPYHLSAKNLFLYD